MLFYSQTKNLYDFWQKSFWIFKISHFLFMLLKFILIFVKICLKFLFTFSNFSYCKFFVKTIEIFEIYLDLEENFTKAWLKFKKSTFWLMFFKSKEKFENKSNIKDKKSYKNQNQGCQLSRPKRFFCEKWPFFLQGLSRPHSHNLC